MPTDGKKKRNKSGKLTAKQETFCNAYVETGNASEAYRRAFTCGKMKPKTVNEAASKLLADGKITTRVRQLQEELKQKSDLTKERILAELEAILDAKITDYLTFDGRSISFKSFEDLTEKQVRAVESLKEGKFGVELKLHGKSWTIERICKMLGYDAPERKELTGKDGKDLIGPDLSKLTDEELLQYHTLLEKTVGN